MAILPIRIYGDPVLNQKALTVDPAEPGLKQLVADMFETMIDGAGVGLAANQVGVLKRVVTINTSGGEDRAQDLVLLNPEIVELSGEIEEEEGCLSVPAGPDGEGILRAKVKRAVFARVRAQGLDGAWFEVAGDGTLGKALQHEIDHLNGTLFIDRLSLARRALVSGKLKAIKAETKARMKKGLA